MRAKTINENTLYLSDNDYNLIFKKLEYKFKNSNNELVNKIKNRDILTDSNLEILLKKFEYSFRKSNPEIISRIKTHLNLNELPNISYSNIKFKNKRDEKDYINSLT